MSTDEAARPTRRRNAVVAAVLALLLLTAVVVVVVVARALGGGGSPLEDREPYTWPEAAAAGAAASASGEDRALLERLAAVPTAVWLTPETYPPGEVGSVVDGLVSDAEDADAVPVLVVYGVTDRDCSATESAGGLPSGGYVAWVGEVAEALGEAPAVVVLEPDALATLDDCPDPDQRLDLLEQAVGVLADAPGTDTYVDAGHASWVDPATIAERLEAVGVDRVRGIATNVANYQTTDDELAYADGVADAVEEDTGTRPHWVVDTGRNGRGSTDEWCNPAGRALGEEPAAADGAEAEAGLDATLWVKPPGESDGTCGGGPPAGEFWTARALQLARAAGW